jgi:hypothetical protein
MQAVFQASLSLKGTQHYLNPSHDLFGTDINPNFFPLSPPPKATFLSKISPNHTRI